MDQRGPSALKERPAAPENDGSGKREFYPREPARGQEVLDGHAGKHVGHRDEKQRRCQRDADPETPAHVAKFGILFLVRGDGARLQRHAADGTTTRLGANDFRMHRAGIFNFGYRERARGVECHPATRAGAGRGLTNLGAHGADIEALASGRCRRRCRLRQRRESGARYSELYKIVGRLQVEIMLGINAKFFEASAATKVVRLAGILEMKFCGGRIDIHAADRVCLPGCGAGGR